jgi:hypothetical protein
VWIPAAALPENTSSSSFGSSFADGRYRLLATAGWMPAALETGSSSCTRALIGQIAAMHGTAIKLIFKTPNLDYIGWRRRKMEVWYRRKHVMAFRATREFRKIGP